jgi:GNAT superfamily N-acetyltransferase
VNIAPVVTARPAVAEDLPALVRLYRLLEEEMTALEHMWDQADGLPEPVEASLTAAIDDERVLVAVGTIDGLVMGFVLAEFADLLPHASEPVGSIRLVFTEPDAREVGVGEATRDLALDWFRAAGVRRFDAHVLPGHRLAKNFFESAGFSARHIVMFSEEADSGDESG